MDIDNTLFLLCFVTVQQKIVIHVRYPQQKVILRYSVTSQKGSTPLHIIELYYNTQYVTLTAF